MGAAQSTHWCLVTRNKSHREAWWERGSGIAEDLPLRRKAVQQALRNSFCSLGPETARRMIKSRRKAWHPCLHFESIFALSYSLLQSPCSHLGIQEGQDGWITSCDKSRNHTAAINDFVIVTRPCLTNLEIMKTGPHL
jgi:hypothetical protein